MTPLQLINQITRQRDNLLAQLESLANLGDLGQTPGADYVEIHKHHIRKAKQLCKRIRTAQHKQDQRRWDQLTQDNK